MKDGKTKVNEIISMNKVQKEYEGLNSNVKVCNIFVGRKFERTSRINSKHQYCK
jgi:hypothetical protein